MAGYRVYAMHAHSEDRVKTIVVGTTAWTSMIFLLLCLPPEAWFCA